MPQHLPSAVHALAAAGRDAQTFEGAVLFADLSGFTPLCDALMAEGDEGAELLAGTLATVFDPILDAIQACGGDVLAFAGDSLTAGFTGMADPKAAAVTAGEAALTALREAPDRIVGGRRFTFSVRIGVGAGPFRVGVARPHQGFGVHWVRGAGVARAVQAQQHAGRDSLSVDGPRPAAPGLLLPLPATADPAGVLAAFLPVDRLRPAAAELRRVVTAFLLFDGVEEDPALRRALSAVFAARERFGAQVIDLDFTDKGAAIVLAWGAVRRHENDVERALSGLLYLQSAAVALGLPPFRAGVTRRRMYAGAGGGSQRRTFALYGHGVALAARLAVSAAWGEVLVGAELVQGGARTHCFKALGARPVKGFVDPVAVHRLVGARSAESTHSPRGLMVGRVRELAALEAHLAAMRDGRGGQLVRIEGEAGVGKSLLVDSLQARNQAGIRWVRLACEEVLRGPLNPVIRYLRALAGQRPGLGLAERRARFDASWRTLAGPDAPALERARVFLESLLGLEPEDPLLTALSPALRGANTLAALKDLVRSWCAAGPVVVVVDDVQWVDDRTEAWLHSLTRNVADWPLLLLVCSRPATMMTTLRPDAVVPVDALPGEEFAALLEARLGLPPTRPLQRFLREKTAGNPFFADKLCQELVASGRIARDGQRVGLEAGAEDAVPVDVADVCVARIDRLPEDARAAVQGAAVLGRRFALPVLAHLLGASSEDALLRLGERPRIWAMQPDGLCAFHHGLLRDAAYDMLLHARRWELHARAAAALLACHPGQEDAHAADIAWQLEQAGDSGAAVEWWVRAVEHAQARYAMAEVVACADRARALAPLVGAAGHARIWDAIAAQADALGVTGARGAGAAKIEAVLADPVLTPPSPAQAARIDARLSRLYAFAGRPDDAIEVATRALHTARRIGEPSIEIDACKRLGVLLGQVGRFAEGREIMRHGLALAEREGDLANQGSLRNNLLTQRFTLGETVGPDDLEQALSLARAAGDLVSLNNMLSNVGSFLITTGEVERGRAVLRESMRVGARLGQRSLEGHSSGMLGQSYMLEGDLVRARKYLEHGRALAEETGNLRILGPAWVRLAALSRAEGDVERALVEVGRARKLAERARYLDLMVHVAGEEAWCLVLLGRLPEADAALQRARDLLEQHQLRGQLARHHALEALLADRTGRPGDRAAHVARAREAGVGGTSQHDVDAVFALMGEAPLG
jgi:tetratricopeptide (TPR) repeat protein